MSQGDQQVAPPATSEAIVVTLPADTKPEEANSKALVSLSDAQYKEWSKGRQLDIRIAEPEAPKPPAKPAGKEAKAEGAEQEAESESATDQETSDEEAAAADEAESEGESAPPEKSGKPEKEELGKGEGKRVKKLLRQRYELQEQLNTLKAEIEQLKAKGTEKPAAPQATPEGEKKPEAPKRPRRDDFEDDPAFEAAMDDYEAKRLQYLLDERDRLKAQQDAKNAIAQQQAKMAKDWKEQVIAAEAEHPDFRDVVFREEVPVSDAMYHAILAVPEKGGAEVLYYLSHHLDECRQIADLSPVQCAFALADIHASLKAAAKKGGAKPGEEKQQAPGKEKTRSAAPPPPENIGGGSAAPTDAIGAAVEKKDFAAYEAERLKQMRAKAKSG